MFDREVGYRANIAIKASGCTRDEISLWGRKGFLTIPPLNDAAGPSRLYSMANIYEFALLKALVQDGVQHENAAEILRERLTIIFARRAISMRRRWPDWRSVTMYPKQWLQKTELHPVQNVRHIWLLPVADLDAGGKFDSRIISTGDIPDSESGYDKLILGNWVYDLGRCHVIAPGDVFERVKARHPTILEENGYAAKRDELGFDPYRI